MVPVRHRSLYHLKSGITGRIEYAFQHSADDSEKRIEQHFHGAHFAPGVRLPQVV